HGRAAGHGRAARRRAGLELVRRACLVQGMDTSASAGASARSRGDLLPLIMLGVVVVVGAVFVLSNSTLVPNDWYALFKAIHVGLAVIWVGGGVMLTVNGIRAKRETDPAKVVLVAQQAAFAGERIFAPAG